MLFRLDQNQQYVLFERSARQSLAWIKEEGKCYVAGYLGVSVSGYLKFGLDPVLEKIGF